MRKDFDDCLDLIKSDKIREFTEKVLRLAPEQFWKAPCSSTGKYHPPEDQVEGGIIIHSRKAVQVALALFKFFKINNQLAKDKIIAACIIHDIQKGGIPWDKYTNYEHGPITARWLLSIIIGKSEPSAEDLANTDSDLMDIIELVRDHMAIWNRPQPTPAIKIGKNVSEKDIWHLIIQLADYWSARKWCSFVCDTLFET